MGTSSLRRFKEKDETQEEQQKKEKNSGLDLIEFRSKN